MTERTLLASIDHQLIGTLHENQNPWAFEYDPAWLANPDRFALSPHWHSDRQCGWGEFAKAPTRCMEVRTSTIV